MSKDDDGTAACIIREDVLAGVENATTTWHDGEMIAVERRMAMAAREDVMMDVNGGETFNA